MADRFDAFAGFRMDGHNVILTGGAQSIGAGVARILTAAGASVMIADLNGDKAAKTAAGSAAETGGTCLGMGCDVTRVEDIAAVVARTVETFGGISTPGNNVGRGPRHPDNLIGRAGQPQDIANTMLWLCSPPSSWVSGQIIQVHGGGATMRLFG